MVADTSHQRATVNENKDQEFPMPSTYMPSTGPTSEGEHPPDAFMQI